MDMRIAKCYPTAMTHAEILADLGETHAERAAAIGHGCADYQVRDWIRRGNGQGKIPPEWWAHVEDAHPTATARDLAESVKHQNTAGAGDDDIKLSA